MYRMSHAAGEDGREIVMIDGTSDLARALGLNYPESPDSCLSVDLSVCVDCLQVPSLTLSAVP